MQGCGLFSEKKISAPDINGPVASMSYAPFQGATHADKANTSIAQIRSDLRMLCALYAAVRTYSSTGGVGIGRRESPPSPA